MTGKFTARPKPEEEELGLKRQELQALENQLVERELYLVSLRAELAAFERLYLKTVGVLYAELDEIEAQIAEVHLRHNPSDREAQAAARRARANAEETRTSATDIALTESVRFSVPPSLKDLYREVARRIHPDLATDEADKARRQRFMAQANRAYEEGNEVRLRKILEEYESSPEAVQGEGIGQDLVRVIRKTAQAKRRLREIEEEVQKVLESELAELKSRTDEAIKNGRDLLEEMAESVRHQIRSARKRLDVLG
jgi:hypothetical protein